VFTPSENINYLTESFGLNSFVSPLIKREVAANLEQKMEEVVVSKKSEPIPFIPEETRSRPYLKYAAVFVLALSVAGSIGYKLYQDRIAEETLLVEKAVQKQVQNKIQEATFFIENPIPSVTLTVKEEKLSYHVVAGAFRNEENAEKIYDELIEVGFKARRLAPNKHGLFPVLYGSYATYTEAQQAMRDIHKSVNPDAWLLIKEL
jgi:cell division protein FtsN